ncbi:HAD-IA family hydrolase [Candidatus Babeliales bacterium]|nr:HAD-IA family hydrolase [Candidatus Babeliales bacterium]
MKKLIFLLSACVISVDLCSTPPRALIIELEDVVLRPDKLEAIKQLGTAMAYYVLKHPTIDPNSMIYGKFFRELTKVRIAGLVNNNEGDFHWGHRVPPVLATWQKGALPCKQLLEATEKTFRHLWRNERTVLTRIAHMALSPIGYRDTHTLVDGVERFLHQHHRYRLFLTANCHQETLEVLRQKYPYVFEAFEGILISGEIRTTKPGPEFYRQLIGRYQLNPEECLCVEAKDANVSTARSLGMQAIKFSNFVDLEKFLREQEQE